MLIVTSVSRAVGAYYLDGRDTGRWTRPAADLLQLHGAPDPLELNRVLGGCDPRTGRYLPAFRPSRRRAGWDLMFSAPKSVSLLFAGSAPSDAAAIRAAHHRAVGGVVGHVQAGLLMTRGARAGRPEPAEGLIGAAFDHSVNAAGEPHVHTHVLVANLSRAGGRWGSIDSSPWFVDRRALGALYQLGLRHHLAEQGWSLDWRLRPDGLADLADVNRADIRAASTQSTLVARSGRYAARASARPSGPPVAAQRAAIRSTDGAAPRSDSGRGHPAGLDQADAALERMVELRLSTRRSDFRRSDVIVVLAATHGPGAPAADSVAWAEGFCGRHPALPSPTAQPRWTTESALELDREVVRSLAVRVSGERSTAPPGNGAAPPAAVAADLLNAPARGFRLLGAPPGRSDLLAQAEVLAGCRSGWEAQGRTVAVASPTRDGAMRWGVLTGIPAYTADRRPDVLVVDQADRRTASELLRLAGRAPGLLIFVEGGTMPRLTNPACHGLAEAASLGGRRLLPEISAWSARARPGGRVADHGRAAAEELLARWEADGRQALLAGLGIEEVRALNRAVVGEPRPAIGWDRFRVGDRVVVLRAVSALPPCGTFGTVADAPRRGRGGSGRSIRIEWSEGRASAVSDGHDLAHIGFPATRSPPRWRPGTTGP